MKNRISLITVALIAVIICIIRMIMVHDHELGWDIFGYYLYLPSTFIHFDPMLHDTGWIKEIVSKYHVSDTLYQIALTKENREIYFFLMGMSIIYAPFFFIGHAIAMIGGYPADGFSLPYQYSLALGMIVYTIAALFILRKILLIWFSDVITTLVLIIIVIGTNYLYFSTVKNLETSNTLFLLLSVLVWNTVQWHRTQKLKNLLGISIAVAIITLVKPSEVVCLIIPLLWGVFNRETLRSKILMLKKNKKQIVFACIAGLLVLLPQMLYWKATTGYFIYDSYKNPGVELNLSSPNIINVLFSFRKGWLIYTPLMTLALLGFVYLRKRNRELYYASLIYFLVSFYIIASWSEWWYGASYSIRPLITTYVILAIPLGLTIEKILKGRILWKSLSLAVITFFIMLNLFQMWQFENLILDPYRTTKAYYFAVFGKTKVSDDARYMLSVEHSFSGERGSFKNELNYNRRSIGYYDYSEVDTNYYGNYIYDSIKQNRVFVMDSNMAFSPMVKTTYKGITDKDHAWIRASAKVMLPKDYQGEMPCMVLTFVRKEGPYAYTTTCVDQNTPERNEWVTISIDYLTPEVRSVDDVFEAYIWHRGKMPIYIDDFRVDVFTPK